MSRNDAGNHTRSENADAHSVDEQVEITHAMWDHGVDPAHDGIKRADIESDLGLNLSYNVRTSLKHLAEAGMVEEFAPPGPSTLVIADWRDDAIVNGEVDETAAQGIEALIEHMQDDDPADEGDASAVADGARETIRSVISAQFDYNPAVLEGFLRKGDQVDKLNEAVKAIEENEDLSKRDEYGEIAFINMPYRYRLTPEAVDLYRA